MVFPQAQRSISRTTLVLAILLGVSVVLHGLVASIRHPVGPRFGETIHADAGRLSAAITAPRLTIAAWNIRRGKGTDGRRDLGRIAAALARRDIDIVALNEVGGAFPPQSDQAARLGHRLDTGWLFTPSQRRWYIDYFGNGLLSAYDPVAWQSVPIVWDRDKGAGHRHLQIVRYLWQGRPFTVVILHAERGPVRDAQIRTAFEAFTSSRHAVLLGDFNANADAAVMASVLAEPSIQSAIPPTEGLIDWILVRGLTITDSGFEPAGPSDHPLVWAEIELLASDDATD